MTPACREKNLNTILIEIFFLDQYNTNFFNHFLKFYSESKPQKSNEYFKFFSTLTIDFECVMNKYKH